MEKKKMDPVGTADADIDNDGDVDKSDKYLHNRRKAIKKAMKKDGKTNKDNIDIEPKMDDKVEESQLAVTRRADVGVEKTRLPNGKFVFKKKPKKEIKVESALNEASVKITYKHKDTGKDHFMHVFTAQDAKRAEKQLKQAGHTVTGRKMAEDEADGVADQAVDKHNCATHVYHEQWGEGQTVRTMHAEPDEHGFVEWYDVMFDHGIEKGVPVAEMKVTLEMSHGNHKKKK
jgi:hypothetical protein